MRIAKRTLILRCKMTKVSHRTTHLVANRTITLALLIIQSTKKLSQIQMAIMLTVKAKMKKTKREKKIWKILKATEVKTIWKAMKIFHRIVTRALKMTS